MKHIDYSLLRNGQIIIKHASNPSILSKAIIEFQELMYDEDVAKFHHVGKLFQVAGEWWVCEEKTIRGVGNTRLSEYLKDDNATYIIREPNYMNLAQEDMFVESFINDANTGAYDVLGILQLAYSLSMYKITGKFAWIGPTSGKRHFVCSTRCAKWDDDILGLYPHWYRMTPAEYVVTPFYKTVITI